VAASEDIDERPFGDEPLRRANPIPLVPPVTTATLFCSLNIVASSIAGIRARREPPVAQR
jgi:hypothetical protein